MSVLVPETQILAAHWPLQDPADDLSLDQIITGTGTSGDVAPFKVYPSTTVPGYPLTVSGPNATYSSAKRFSTGNGSSTWPAIIEYCQTFETDGSGPACWAEEEFTAVDRGIYMRFKRHTNVAAPIFGMGECYQPSDGGAGKWWNTEPRFFFYFGVSGNLHIGITGTSISTGRKDSINSGNTYMDDEWHEALATVRLEDELTGESSTSARRIDLYVDNVHLGSVSHAGDLDDWTAVDTGNPASIPFFLGSGFMYRTTTTIHWPDTSATVSNGACGADICDLRVYCGSVVPTPEPVISSIMFSCNT